VRRGERTGIPRRALLLVGGAVWLAAGAAGAQAPEPPEVVVREALDEALAVLRDDSLDSGERRRALEAIAFEQFDFQVMSKLVLARGWRRFDAAQRERFIREFQRELSRNYGGRLERYSREQVEIERVREEPRGDVSVLTRVVGGGFDGASIHFRLRRRQERWLGIDVVIEGVSLVSSYRSQFKELLSSGGPDGVIETLAERNERLGDPGEGGDAEGAGEADAGSARGAGEG